MNNKYYIFISNLMGITSVIDLYNNILKYNNDSVIVIIDGNGDPWFSAGDIARILGYKKPNDAVRILVNDIDKMKFKNLKKYVNNIPKNSQPHSIYINETGLYDLLSESKKPAASEFRRWLQVAF